METSLSFTTLICHTSTRLLIQETVLPALHSSRGVFNVFDRRLPATVIAGGFLSLGNKLAKNGRLEMDSEHLNNPNIALIFVSFFSFMAMMSETETFLKEASSILKQGSPKVAIQDHITSEKMNIQTKCLSLVVFHCLFLNQSRFSARARKNLWWVCKHSAMASQIVDTWWYIYRIAWAYWNPQKCDINTSGKIGLLVWDSQSRQIQCQFTGFLRFVPKP